MSVNTMPSQSPDRLFKWACLAIATLFGAVVLYMIVDLKRDVTRSLDSAQSAVSEANTALGTVNEKLPTIVGEVKKGTEALSGLAEDVELLKSVMGIEKSDRGLRGLTRYADEIETVLHEATTGKNAMIKIEAFIGTSLKDVETVDEFLIGLNKEIVVILAVAKSKEEVLWRVCHSGVPRRKPFYIAIDDGEPVTLSEFIKSRHQESAGLPDYEP